MQTRSTVFVCESQPVVLVGLRSIFATCDDLHLTGTAEDLTGTLRELAERPADLLLIGQPPSARSALPLLSQGRDAGVVAKIVLWVGEMSELDAFRAIQMGARGVVERTQSIEILLECLRTVLLGSVWIGGVNRGTKVMPGRRVSSLRLTPREREIVHFICRGMKNKEIAEALSITPGTVKVHLMHIFEKAGVKDRFQLALQGRQMLAGAEDGSPLSQTAEA